MRQLHINALRLTSSLLATFGLMAFTSSSSNIGAVAQAATAGEINNQAVNLLNNKQSAKAAELFAEADRLQPNDPSIETNLGYALLLCGRLDESLTHLQHAAQIRPDFSAAWLDMGLVFEQKADTPNAIKAFEHFVAVEKASPERTRIQAHLADLKAEEKRDVKDTSTTDYLLSITSQNQLRWPKERMPVKVFIADGTKLTGYKPQYLDELKQAFSDWKTEAGDRLTYVFVPLESNADITVNWSNDLHDVASIAEGGDTKFRGNGKGMDKAMIKLLLIDPAPQKLTPELMRWITLHEVGHAFGLLGHSRTPQDIMYATTHGTESMPSLSARDGETIRKFYDTDLTQNWLTLNDEGIEASQNGDYAAALEKYSQALQLKPDADAPRNNAVRAHYKWAIELINKGDMKSPESHFKQALAMAGPKRDQNIRILVEAYSKYLRLLNRGAEATAIETKYH